MPKGAERRSYRRIDDFFTVKITELGIDTGRFMNVARADNLSASGIRIRYDRRLAVGSRVNVSFMKPDSLEIFNADARVVRTEKLGSGMYELAITFVDLGPELQRKLDGLIAGAGG